MRILPRGLVPRTLAKLEAARAWCALIIAMRRRSATELWLGDSHALCFNQGVSLAMFVKTRDGQLVLRFGARLMHSVARNGLPARTLRVARFVGRFGRPGSIVPIMSAGEIDIRCHLPGREPDYSFVAEYVDVVVAMIETTKAPRGYIVVPPPPNVHCPNIEQFPIKGTIEDRVEAFRGIRSALETALASHPKVELLDFTDVLSNPDGTMRETLSDDGCHTNAQGISAVRSRVAELDLSAAAEARV